MSPSLSEDEVDDILYFARVNEVSDLDQFLTELAGQKSCGKKELVAAAIDEGSGNGALHYACANGHIDSVKTILALFDDSTSSDTTKQDGEGASASQLDPALMAYINLKNKSGNTALHWASLNGHLATVELLLKRKADPTVLNAAGHDAVYEAELNDKSEVVDLLLKEGLGLDTGVKGQEGDEDDDEDEQMEGGEDKEPAESTPISGPADGDEQKP